MLSDVVVERVSVQAPTSEAVGIAIQKAHATLRETLVRGDLALVQQPLSQRDMQRQYDAADLLTKMRFEHAGALRAGVKRDFLVDAMANPDSVGDFIGSFGVSFKLLLERELYDTGLRKGLSEVRVYRTNEWFLDANGRGGPLPNGVLDERMGPVRYTNADGSDVVCPVCSNTRRYDAHIQPALGESGNCPGHLGHIVLPGAVWNPLFVPVIHAMLSAFCWHCGDLPYDDAHNKAMAAKILASGSTRAARIQFAGRAVRSAKCCLQCQKKQRCGVCASDNTQCNDCARLPCWRPLLRTAKQAANAVKKMQTQINGVDTDDSDELIAERRDDPAQMQRVRASRSLEYSGFPCDAVLDGNVPAAHRANYTRYAARAYGSHADNDVLVLHGERVREIIAQMSPQFLSLFIEHALETVDDVSEWFYALVPRVVPVAPNDVRPCDINQQNAASGDGSAPVIPNDLSKRYILLVQACASLSRAIDARTPQDQPALFYDSIQTVNNRRMRVSAVERDTLYDVKRNNWFCTTQIDFPHLDAYGRMQYYYANVISAKRALMFLPSQAAAHNIGGGARRRHAGGTPAVGANGRVSQADSQALADRLGGKEGLVRGHLSGKRVDFTARTVISPDDNLGIGDIRLPYCIAAQLVVRERVNSMQVVEQTHRAERIRTGDLTPKQHFLYGGRRCSGCAFCEELYVTARSDVCMFTAAGDQRVRITDVEGVASRQTEGVSQRAMVRDAGAIIERPLRVGDYVALNRQPTLHDGSFMTMRVAQITGDGISRPQVNSIGIHPLVTTPFNGDFDGDEMNLHVATSEATRTEMVELMAVARKMTSARNGAPLIALKQDAATGMYELTSPNTFLTKGEACNIIMHAAREFDEIRLPAPAIRYRDASGQWQSLWTGLQVANVAVPERMNYKNPRNFDLHRHTLNYARGGVGNNRKLPLVCANGELLFGQFHGDIAGKGGDSFHRAIQLRGCVSGGREQAENEAVQFINRCAWIATAFLTMRGFSVGLADCTMPMEKRREVYAITRTVASEMENLVRGADDILRHDKYADRVDIIEQNAMAIERSGFNKVARVVNSTMQSDNAFLRMKVSGGKGSEINPVQIMGCLGGQQVEGRRAVDRYITTKKISDRMPGARRAISSNIGTGRETTSGGALNDPSQRVDRAILLPPGTTRLLDNIGLARLDRHTFRSIYPGATEGGFVSHSFYDGLTPQEFFAHAASGREGLTDTACKTSETGGMMRLAMKSLESLYVAQDRTVRDATNRVISYRYGGCAGYDPRYLQSKQLEFVSCNDATFVRAAVWSDDDIVMQTATPADAAVLRAEETALRQCVADLRAAIGTKRDGSATIMTPSNLNSLIMEVMGEYGLRTNNARWLSFADERVACVCDTNDETVVSAAQCAALVDAAMRRWRCAQPRTVCDYVTECEVRLRLCSKQVVRRLGLTTESLMHVLKIYEEILYRTHVAAGESVGAISVQSIGEPATQMTLNSFHFTGKKGEMNMMGGIDQMKVLSNATATEKLKGIAVSLPLRAGGVLISSGQRNLAPHIVTQLISRETFGARTEVQHRNAVRTAFASVEYRNATTDGVLKQTIALARVVCMQSVGERECARLADEHTTVCNGLMTDIDRLFGVAAVEQDPAPRTLDRLVHCWRLLPTAQCQAQMCLPSAYWSRAEKALMFAVRPEHVRRCTDKTLLRESLWRALVPYFGSDVAFVVLASAVSSDVAVLALDCSTAYEQKLYDYIRLQRTNVFVELIVRDTDAHAVQRLLSDEAMVQKLHKPLPVVKNVAGVEPEDDEKADQQLQFKVTEITRAQTRRVFKNFVCTRIIDVTLRASLLYEPIDIDAATNQASVRFATGADAPSESERTVCDGYYGFSAFDVGDVGCRREACVAARSSANPPLRSEVGCLNSFVLSLRLDTNWFLTNDVTMSQLQSSVERCLGPYFHVLIGDENCVDYIPVRIRVYQCSLYEAYASLNTAALATLDFQPLLMKRNISEPTSSAEMHRLAAEEKIDFAIVVLDRAKWVLLGHTFSGPRFGSVVAVDDSRQTVFTPERGLEHTRTAEIVCNSADYYYLLGLRGIDTTKATTSAIHDVAAVLGIEAARKALVNEYQRVLAESGTYVYRAHAALRSDLQTVTGSYEPLTHTGIARSAHDPCQLATHREPATMFAKAALNNRTTAPLVSPSACVMFGQMLQRQGTGIVHTMLDIEALQNNEFVFEQPEPGAILDARQEQRERAVCDMAAAVQPHSPAQTFSFQDIGAYATSPIASTGAFSPVSDEFAFMQSPAPTHFSPAPSRYKPVALPPTLLAYSPTSPGYTPTSHAYQPTSPAYSPASPAYSPTSPAYSPTSPAYSPTSPEYVSTNHIANDALAQDTDHAVWGTEHATQSTPAMSIYQKRHLVAIDDDADDDLLDFTHKSKSARMRRF